MVCEMIARLLKLLRELLPARDITRVEARRELLRQSHERE